MRSLDDCCRELGIRNADAHSALGDAHATALLLSGFLHGIPDWEGWRPALRAAAELEWPRIEERAPPVDAQAEPCRAQPASPFLNRLQSGNPGASDVHHADAVMLDAAAEYADLLDQCLIDARLSEHEKSALVDMANALGLTREDCLRIHEHYFADVPMRRGWTDGSPTMRSANSSRSGSCCRSMRTVIDAAIAGTTVTDTATGRMRDVRHGEPYATDGRP